MTRTVLCLFVLGASALQVPAVHAAPVSTQATPSVLVPVGRSTPQVVSGILTVPSKDSPERIAWAFLKGRPEWMRGVELSTLTVERALPRASGALVIFEQAVGAVPVFGARVAVRIDGAGRVRWAGFDALPLDKEFVTTPRVAAGHALTAMLRGPGRRGSSHTLVAAEQTRLVIVAQPGTRTPRLAWQVRLPRDIMRQEVLQGFVDAETGRVLSYVNLARNASPRGNVFEFNPVTSLDQTQMGTFARLPEGATHLESPDVLVRNCIDNDSCMPVSFNGFDIEIASCEPEPKAETQGGDFLHISRPAVDTESEDQFAEVQMYYHVEKVYDHVRGIYGTEFKLDSWPLTAVTNMRLPDFNALSSYFCTGGQPADPNKPLVGFDNAAFMPQGSLGGAFPPADWIVFGQGTTADFSYDGDVVYHEFGHALMFSITSLAGVSMQPDVYGLDPAAGGMNEGYPDYLSSAITGDAKVGEYASAGFGLGGQIRDLANDKRCPQDLWGQSHADSEPFTGALWEIRVATAETDRATLDAAVLNVMASLSSFDNFASVAQKTAAEIDVALSIDAGDAARAVFDDRGLSNCDARVVDMTAAASQKDILYLVGTDMAQLDRLPAAVQFKIDLSAPSAAITLQIAQTQSGGVSQGGTPQLVVIAKADAEPILWNWTGAQPAHDAVLQANVTFTGARGKAVINGPFPAGTVHVQLVNQGPTWVAQGISVAASDATPVDPDPTDPVDPDPTDPADPTPTGPSTDESGGCGCRVAPQGGAPLTGALFFSLAVIGWVLLRRRD